MSASHSTEYTRVESYIASGRLARLQQGTIEVTYKETCLDLTSIHQENQTDNQIGIQFQIDSNPTTGGYVEFTSATTLTCIRDAFTAFTESAETPHPVSLVGEGDLITENNRHGTNTKSYIYPTDHNQEPVSVTLTPVESQNHTGTHIQLGDSPREGASITLTPAQTNHLEQTLQELLDKSPSGTTPAHSRPKLVAANGHTRTATEDRPRRFSSYV